MTTTAALTNSSSGRTWLERWTPEDANFWAATGKRLAWRTLVTTTANLTLAFIVWFLVSALVVRLPGVGFKLSSSQLFWLAVMAVTFCFGSKDGPELEKRRKARLKPESLCDARAPEEAPGLAFLPLLPLGLRRLCRLGARLPHPGLPGRWSNAPIGKDAL